MLNIFFMYNVNGRFFCRCSLSSWGNYRLFLFFWEFLLLMSVKICLLIFLHWLIWSIIFLLQPDGGLYRLLFKYWTDLCVSLDLKWISHRQHIYESRVFIYSGTLCLLIGTFSSSTFKVIIDNACTYCQIVASCLFFCSSFSPFLLLLFSSLVIWWLSLVLDFDSFLPTPYCVCVCVCVCVYIYCRFLFCGCHEVHI